MSGEVNKRIRRFLILLGRPLSEGWRMVEKAFPPLTNYLGLQVHDEADCLRDYICLGQSFLLVLLAYEGG